MQTDLGVIYDSGLGVPKDYAQAVVRYDEAADHGDAGAQFNLGLMHAQGRGVPQDYAQAHMWFSSAASLAPTLQFAARQSKLATRSPPK